MSPILNYHAQWFRTFYNASCLIANVYTHTWRQWQAPALSRNYPKYISTIPFLLSYGDISVHNVRLGTDGKVWLLDWGSAGMIMAYDGKDPPRGCSCLWIVMLLVFNTYAFEGFDWPLFGDLRNMLASQLSSVNCGKDIFFNSPPDLRKVMSCQWLQCGWNRCQRYCISCKI